MKCAVIDIGSNSIRLSAYDAEKNTFKILFKEKIMAGLAGYVENNRLTREGISCACESLLEFKEALELLQIDNVSVLATASLRNIDNTDEALAEICAATNFKVEVISGEEEAQYGYIGAMCDLAMTDGVFVDIGGASTEVAAFSAGKLRSAKSFPIGSLSLYRECVKKIIPGKTSFKKIEEKISEELRSDEVTGGATRGRIACVGGTARAALKLAQKAFSLPDKSRSFSAVQLEKLCERFQQADKNAINLILKAEPERIHTIVPGLMILRRLVRTFEAEEIVVSSYSVREGYLCQAIQAKM